MTYRIYKSTGTEPFNPTMELTATTATIAGISTSAPTRVYVTAFIGSAESVPSNTVTNTPVPPPLLGLTFEAEAGAITAPFFVSGAYIQQTVLTEPANGGRAAYVFNVTNAAAYTVSMLVNAPNIAANSVCVNIDAEPVDANFWDIPVTSGFEPRTVTWWGESGTHSFALGIGQHTLIIRGREAGTQIDRIMLIPVTTPVPQPPQPPTNLRAMAVSSSRIDVGWTLAAPEIVKIQRSPDNLLWAEIATVPPGNSYYTDGGLRRGKVYYYRARTFNSVGFSTFSNVAFDRTLKH